MALPPLSQRRPLVSRVIQNHCPQGGRMGVRLPPLARTIGEWAGAKGCARLISPCGGTGYVPALDWHSLCATHSADVVQLVERRSPKPHVAGSSPVVRAEAWDSTMPRNIGNPPGFYSSTSRKVTQCRTPQPTISSRCSRTTICQSIYSRCLSRSASWPRIWLMSWATARS